MYAERRKREPSPKPVRQKAAVDGGRDEGRRALVSAASAVGAEFLEAEVALKVWKVHFRLE